MPVIPGETPCLKCVFSNYDRETFKDVVKGVLSPTVNVIGAMQSLEVVKFILGSKDRLVNSFISYNGLKQELKKILIQFNKEGMRFCFLGGQYLNGVFIFSYSLPHEILTFAF
jgi:molybdopterin/thiamine biosynthesis adenylyltransferase